MKSALLFLFVILTTIVRGQVILERSYTENSYMAPVKIEEDGYKWIGLDSARKIVALYNSDHSSWKNVTLRIPSGFQAVAVTCPSKYLFNSDSKIEFLVTYLKASSPIQYQTDLVDDGGSVIQSFPNCYSGNIWKVDGKWKLEFYVNSSNGATNNAIYSLPGQYTGQLKAPTGNSNPDPESSMAPNPMESTAVIRYQLPGGINVGQVEIYNAAGQKVQTYLVSENSGSVTVERGALAPGVYSYKVVGMGVASGGRTFIVR